MNCPKPSCLRRSNSPMPRSRRLWPRFVNYAAAGKPKRKVAKEQIDSALAAQVKALVAQGIREAIAIPNKAARQERLDEVKRRRRSKLKSADDPNRERHVKLVFHELEYTEVRNMILEKGSRADGRGPADIRPITCEVSALPRTHGSADFHQGENSKFGRGHVGDHGRRAADRCVGRGVHEDIHAPLQFSAVQRR